MLKQKKQKKQINKQKQKQKLKQIKKRKQLVNQKQILIVLRKMKVMQQKKIKKKNKKTKKKTNKEPSNDSIKEITMSATGYTAKCTGCSGITATGIDLNKNPNAKVVAVDPSVIPLGSRVWVSGYGEAIAGDTGGAIKGNRIDLHFPSKDAAYAFGNGTVTVKVLK